MIPSDKNAFDYAAPPTYRVALAMTGQRPHGVTILAILKCLSVFLAVAVIWLCQVEITTEYTVRLAGPPVRIGPYDVSAGLDAMMNDVYASFIRRLRMAQVAAALDIPAGLALGWGLWKLRPWARAWALGLACLSGTLGIFAASLSLQAIMVPTILLNGAVIWYFLRYNVSAAFEAY